MSTFQLIILFLLMSIVTYISRRALLRVPGNFFSVKVLNGLTYIPIGILAGLIFPSIFISNNQVMIQPLFIAGSILCLVLMKLRRNVFISFGFSVVVVVVLHIIVK